MCLFAFHLVVGLEAPSASPQQRPATEPPVVRVTTRLVQANVIVLDKAGQPVTDLTKDDFLVQDQGKTQTISTFLVTTNNVTEENPTPLPPNTFSNRLAQQGKVPASISVILLDALNTNFQQQTYAKEQVIRFLRQLRPQDRVALYMLGSRLAVLHDFTTDAAELVAALESYQGHPSSKLAGSQHQNLDPSVKRALRASQSEARLGFDLAGPMEALFEPMQASYIRKRAELTSAALWAVANRLSGFPGRKNLVWVSSAFPVTQEIAQILSKAGVAVYPVDAAGLVVYGSERHEGPYIDEDSTPGVVGNLGDREGPAPAMETLAERTGGRAFYNSNDLQGAIRQAIDDSRLTYTIGFYPANTEWDGKFHKMKVEVRRPGVRIHTRLGYYAVDDTTESEAERRAAELREADRAPLDATGIGFTVTADSSGPSGGNSALLRINISRQDVWLDSKDGHWNGAIEILYAQHAADGRLVAAWKDKLSLALTPEIYKRAEQDGITLTKQLALKPGINELRIAVRDANSGAIGTVTIPLVR